MNDIPSGLALGAVMTRDPVSIDTAKSLTEASSLMEKMSCRHLAVTEDDKLVGVLSQRDLTLAESATKRSQDDLTVGDAYIAFPYRADKDDSLETVLDDMMSLGIGSVLVVDDKESLIGILTTYDVCRILRDLLTDTPLTSP